MLDIVNKIALGFPLHGSAYFEVTNEVQSKILAAKVIL
jgi:hypothetical protein